MRRETAFTMEASGIKFGPGVTREVGHDMGQWGVRRAMVVTDPHLSGAEPVSRVLEALRDAGIDAVLFDRVRVEPTDASFLEAIAFAADGPVRRLCRRRRRLEHRHRQGGEPVRDLSRGLPRLCQPADRAGAAGPRAS